MTTPSMPGASPEPAPRSAPFAPPPAMPSYAGPRYAGFWVRFLAVFIDGILLQVASLIIILPVAFVIGIGMAGAGQDGAEAAGAVGAMFGYTVSVVIQWIYEAGFLSSAKQATPGKMALSLVVTDENGGRLSFGRASGRHFAKYLSAIILLIGFLIQPFTEKRQALHDLLARTLVMRK